MAAARAFVHNNGNELTPKTRVPIVTQTGHNAAPQKKRKGFFGFVAWAAKCCEKSTTKNKEKENVPRKMESAVKARKETF